MQIYHELPFIFARDIARSQQQSHPSQPQISTTVPPGASLKRDRPVDHTTPEPTMKRRDTGDHKTPMLPPSTPASAVRGFPNTAATPQTHSSPSIPSQGFNPNAAAMEARNRAQQLQMRQQMQLQQASLQAQQANRQASPPQMQPPQMQPPQMPGMGPVPVPAQQPQQPQHIQQLLQMYGQQGLRMFQILQTPQHPFVQQMIKAVPNFASMSIQQQMERMLQMQVCSCKLSTIGSPTNISLF